MTNTTNTTPENERMMTSICTISEDDIYEYVSGLSDDDIPDEYSADNNPDETREERLHRYAEDLVQPAVRDALEYLENEYDRYFICEGDRYWTIYTCTTDEEAEDMRSEFDATDIYADVQPDDSAECDVENYSWTMEDIKLYSALDESLDRLNLLDDNGKLRSKFTPDDSEKTYDTPKFIAALVETVRNEINNLGYESNYDAGGFEAFTAEYKDPIGTLEFLGCEFGVDRVYDHLQCNGDDIVDEAWNTFLKSC